MEIKHSIIPNFHFSMLEGKIDQRVLEGIKAMGIEKPTRIQAESLPHLMMHKDLIGAAKTGSGKTLAFLVPTIDDLIRLKFTRKHGKYLSSHQINVSKYYILDLLHNMTVSKLILTKSYFKNVQEYCKYCYILFALGTGCIILSPTRELALQTYQVMKKLLTCIDLSHALIVGGEKKVKDIVALKKGKRQ